MSDYDFYKRLFLRAVNDDDRDQAIDAARQCEQIAIEARAFDEAREWAQEAGQYESGECHE